MSRAGRRNRGDTSRGSAADVPDLEAGNGGIGEGKDGESSAVDDKPGRNFGNDDATEEETGLLASGEADDKTNGASRRAARNNKNNGNNIPGIDENDRIEESNIQSGALRVLEPLRQDPFKVLGLRQKRLERLAAEQMPEIHYLGQIISGKGLLEDSTEGASVRWKVDTGKAWQILGGSQQGQTQVSYCKARDTEAIPFNHPIDLHYAEAGLQGWGAPRISFQCYRLDWTGRRILVGYGFEHLPTAPGHHRMEINMWRPTGTRNQELEAYLLGRTPALVSHEPIYDSAWRERCRLVTIPAGTVHMEVTVLTRNANTAGIDQRNI